MLVYSESWESYKNIPWSRSWGFQTAAMYCNSITTQKTQRPWNCLISYDKGHPKLTPAVLLVTFELLKWYVELQQCRVLLTVSYRPCLLGVSVKCSLPWCINSSLLPDLPATTLEALPVPSTHLQFLPKAAVLQCLWISTVCPQCQNTIYSFLPPDAFFLPACILLSCS